MKDQEHAAKVAQKLKEDEDVQAALRMQDEIMARRMQETEAKRYVLGGGVRPVVRTIAKK